MKKILTVLVLALAIAGCDSSTNEQTQKRDSTNSGTILRDTVLSRKVVYDTVKHQKVLDTTVETVDRNIITGSVVDKETGKSSGIIVCSEIMNKCAKTNSAGLYQISQPKFAARSLGNDTVSTPENVDISLSDTSIVTHSASPTTIDTTSTDTVTTSKIKVSGNDTLAIDSVVIVDTVKIEVYSDTVNVTITNSDTVSVKDTLTFVSNGVILKEVPIVSWGDILGPKYIVQRDISAIDSTTNHTIATVEAVYFMTSDSVAKVITLGKSKYDFSGFMYTLYDDSSYRNDFKIYNLFVRGKDSSGNIVTKTEIEHFSERFGDIRTKILKNLVGIPQAMIPAVSFVPNNTDIGNFVKSYSNSDTSRWVSINFINNTSFDDGMKYKSDYENWIVAGYDSVSFEIQTDSNFVFDQELITHPKDPNNSSPDPSKWYLVKNVLMPRPYFYVWNAPTMEGVKVRNIKLHYYK